MGMLTEGALATLPARTWVRFASAPGDGEALATLRARRPRAGRAAMVELHACDVPGSFGADVNPVITGSGPVVFVAVLRRRPDVDHAFFSRHWREEHARFGRAVEGAHGYIQLHADEGSECDGIVLVPFADEDALRQGLGAPIIGVEARADEAAFVDHNTSYGMVCELVTSEAPA